MVESASDVDEQRMKACSLRALVPTIIGIVMWNVIGVMNMESSLHIEYSLGSSSPWHSFWHRGDPGEVVRHWWVPIYDQWSGLGYRLPTQGLLTDTPLAYLALIPQSMEFGLLFGSALCGSCSHKFIAGLPRG